jgi:hypothetical protein
VAEGVVHPLEEVVVVDLVDEAASEEATEAEAMVEATRHEDEVHSETREDTADAVLASRRTRRQVGLSSQDDAFTHTMAQSRREQESPSRSA